MKKTNLFCTEDCDLSYETWLAYTEEEVEGFSEVNDSEEAMEIRYNLSFS